MTHLGGIRLVTVALLMIMKDLSLASKMGPTTPSRHHYAKCMLSTDMKERFVDIHNELRSLVNPQAADMEYLVKTVQITSLRLTYVC